MSSTTDLTTINIRPGVTVLTVLSHLNYQPWFALAEFVDNSLQSYFAHRDEIERIEGKGFKLKVSIELEGTSEVRMTIRDNAAGIFESEYARAFKPAELPVDRTGLSEFGMGMKSAACWFAPHWSVRTSALGEPVERTVTFDIDSIVRGQIEKLPVQHQTIQPDAHFTEIILSRLHKPLQLRTISKIKEHLASIYRVFIREGDLELFFDGVSLTESEPKVLFAPFFKTLSEKPQLWRKEIDLDFGLGLRVRGFAALREVGSVAKAGFALFRRKRLIQGSADEGYRPKEISGSQNKATYQRLFGELHLDGFEVSHTKDGFRWEENEEVFLALLKEKLNAEPLPLLDQAMGHKARGSQDEFQKGADIAVARTADVIENEVPPVLERQIDEPPEVKSPPTNLPSTLATVSHREIDIELNGCKWKIVLDLSYDPAVGEWVSISDQPALSTKDAIRRLSIRLSLAHPFMERFGGTNPDEIEPLLRVAVAICLAEVAARDSGVKGAGTIRRNVNKILRDALSKP